jgi:hypothetical protein
MSAKRREVPRRDFLRGAAGVALAGSMGGLTLAGEDRPSGEEGSPKKKPRVVLIRNEEAVSAGGATNEGVLARMLDEAVASLMETNEPQEAWKLLIKASDTVGIKSNVWSFLRTPPAFEQAIRRRVMEVGVPAERIGIDDRGILQHPVFRKATALVNVRPLRTHHWAGVGSLIKNYIMFVEEPSAWHGDSCADLAGIWDLPVVKGQTRLNILLMLTPLFQSKGPHDYSSEFIWPYKGLLVGTDPVATDATGLRILEAKRKQFFGGQRPFNVSPKHIQVADRKFGLGVADPAKIDLVKLGWSDGALI